MKFYNLNSQTGKDGVRLKARIPSGQSIATKFLGDIQTDSGTKEIFIKIYIESCINDRKYDTGLFIEELISKYVINFMHTYMTNHVPKFFVFESCDSFVESIENEGSIHDAPDSMKALILPNQAKESIRSLLSRAPPENKRLRLFVNESLNDSIPLEKFVISKEFMDLNKEQKEKVIDSIYFQVLWTSLCLAFLGINHDDMHWRNILIQKSKNERQLYHMIKENTFFEWNHEYIAKIIDFDWAHWPNVVIQTKGQALKNLVFFHDVQGNAEEFLCYLPPLKQDITKRFMKKFWGTFSADVLKSYMIEMFGSYILKDYSEEELIKEKIYYDTPPTKEIQQEFENIKKSVREEFGSIYKDSNPTQ